MKSEFDIKAGCLRGARWVPSPNFNERPAGEAVDLLVIHNISLPPAVFGGDYIEQFFQNGLNPAAHPYFTEIASLQVSAHVLIRRCGEVVQFVNFDQRAWHAGISCFEGREGCNDFSIGIELEGTDAHPFSDAQYDSLAAVTRAICRAYPRINTRRMIGHSDIAPGRKTDPGPCFDWPRFRADLND